MQWGPLSGRGIAGEFPRPDLWALILLYIYTILYSSGFIFGFPNISCQPGAFGDLGPVFRFASTLAGDGALGPVDKCCQYDDWRLKPSGAVFVLARRWIVVLPRLKVCF